MKYIFGLFIVLAFAGSCEREPLPILEPVVGHTYQVHDEMGNYLYEWSFFEDGSIKEISVSGVLISSYGSYEFDRMNGIKTLEIKTWSVNTTFACDYSGTPEVVYLTDLVTYKIFVLNLVQ